MHREILAKLAYAADPTGAPQFDHEFQILKQTTDALIDHYGPGHAPKTLIDFRNDIVNWENNRRHPDYLHKFVAAKTVLPEVMKYRDDSVSFTEVLDSYASQPKLEEDIAALIQKLEQMLAECGDVVSAQVEKELRRILESLRSARGKSIINLTAWLDLTSKFVAKVAEKYCGLPFCGLALDALKLALASKVTVMLALDKAEKEFVVRLGMPFLKGAQDDYKQVPSVEDVEKRIADRQRPAELPPAA